MAIKKAREAQTAERNEKIESMNMHDLKKYLCMKNNQNPEKCDGCPGIANCTAGQRAVVLLNAEAKRTSKDGTNVRKMTQSEKAKQMRQMFLIACQKQNMAEWLMEQEGISRDAARTKLRYWAERNTDIANQYGFEEKYKAEAKTGGGNQQNNRYNVALREKAMQEYREAAMHEDPVAFVMEKYGLAHVTAYMKFYGWKKKYGDIEQKTKDAEMSEQVTETVSEDCSETNIEDFLSETEPMHEENAQKEQEKDFSNDDLYQAIKKKWNDLESKRISLKNRLDELNDERTKLTDKVEWVKKAEDALLSTWSLFSSDPLSQETDYEKE